MKCTYLHLAALLSFGLAAPLFVFADTWLGAPNVPPPQGNTPGVIWNSYGLSKTQMNAEINVSGTTTAGSVTLSQAPKVNFFNDIKLESGKAFFVNKPGLATFNMGNWDGFSDAGLKFTVNGDIQVSPTKLQPIQGQEGRVQAEKFCFNPGNPSDCIDAQKGWPTGQSGLYVQKIGDAMTGPLSIVTPSFGVDVSGGNFGGNFSGKNWGVEAVSDNLGLYAHMNVAGVGTAVWGTGGKVGGLFEGSTTGLQARTSAAGSGKAVIGSNGAYGGDFSGTQYGVFGQGGLTGGYFVNAGTGFYAQLGTANYGLYSNGKIFTTGTMHATGDLDTSGNLTVTGNIVAPANQLSNCQLVPPANNANPGFADGVLGTCPAGTPILNGIKRLANMTALYCCAL